MNKRGFTLIEIIVCIILIVIVGTTTTVITINNKKDKLSVLKSNSNQLKNALEVYLDKNKEIIKNISENAKGAIVTLEVLKNEGLISDDLDINYKKEYYLLSNVLLASPSINCDANQVELAVVESWNVDTDKVIYVCSNGASSDLESRITQIEKLLKSKSAKSELIGEDGYYIAKGGNPNNYVKVINDGNESLWRILEINNDDIVLIAGEDKLKLKWKDYFSSLIPPNPILESGLPKKMNSLYFDDRYIAKKRYSTEIFHRSTAESFDLYSPYSSYKADSYVGLASYINVINSKTTNNSYLLSLLKGTVIGYYQTNGASGVYYVCESNDENHKYIFCDAKESSLPENFFPVVTLNACVDLKKQTECSDNKFGSSSCPYLLDLSKC